MGGLGLNDYKIKIEILTIMHAWCKYDHEMNENNEVNEEKRSKCLGRCKMASGTPQEGS